MVFPSVLCSDLTVVRHSIVVRTVAAVVALPIVLDSRYRLASRRRRNGPRHGVTSDPLLRPSSTGTDPHAVQ